jgi:chaperone required for assembly of F1-ATPase
MKRFYRNAQSVPVVDGYGIALDGRLVKTPGRHELVVPGKALATALASEWNAQREEIHAAAMPLTRLAGIAIDRAGRHRQAIIEQVANYAGTDLVCYRAQHPPALAARQHAMWQPLIDWAGLRYDAPLAVTIGIVPTTQPASSLRAFAAEVADRDDFALTALYAATIACGSLVIALALIEGHIDAAEAFAASQLDESFQIEAWGEDAEQVERRRLLAGDIAAATQFTTLLNSP